MRTLLIGYGNLDREDDGVAWHILCQTAEKLGRPVADPSIPELCPDGNEPDLWFMLQLTPEVAETISQYDRVYFIDAHTGNVPEDLHIETVMPGYQTSPFTHHMTPATVMGLVEVLYQKEMPAVLVSVRGYQFEFHTHLSSATSELAQQASEYLYQQVKPS
jgi:hydrogenase maturation protease